MPLPPVLRNMMIAAAAFSAVAGTQLGAADNAFAQTGPGIEDSTGRVTPASAKKWLGDFVGTHLSAQNIASLKKLATKFQRPDAIQRFDRALGEAAKIADPGKAAFERFTALQSMLWRLRGGESTTVTIEQGMANFDAELAGNPDFASLRDMMRYMPLATYSAGVITGKIDPYLEKPPALKAQTQAVKSVPVAAKTAVMIVQQPDGAYGVESMPGMYNPKIRAAIGYMAELMDNARGGTAYTVLFQKLDAGVASRDQASIYQSACTAEHLMRSMRADKAHFGKAVTGASAYFPNIVNQINEMETMAGAFKAELGARGFSACR